MVGLVRGIHGLRGAVRVEVLSDDPARFEPGSVLFREGEDDPLTVAWRSVDGPGLLVRFKESGPRPGRGPPGRLSRGGGRPDAAGRGRGLVARAQGVPVSTADGEELGTVEDVFRAGGGEVFVVSGGDGARCWCRR